MLVTAAEASKKWCPFARISRARSDNSYNRPEVGASIERAVEHSPCIADACMMWRYLNPDEKIEIIFVAGENDEDFARRRDAAIAARMGYCGLAGKQSYE